MLVNALLIKLSASIREWYVALIVRVFSLFHVYLMSVMTRCELNW